MARDPGAGRGAALYTLQVPRYRALLLRAADLLPTTTPRGWEARRRGV